MNNQQEKNFITNKVLNKIKRGEVKMRPKTYFIFKAVLLALGTLFLTLFIICLISFIVFSLRANGVLFLPKFGFPGIKLLLGSLPWLLVFLAIILIILLQIFAKHFSFVYRRPIIYSLLVVIMIVSAGSFLIDRTSFHPNLFWKAQEGRLPAMGGFYRHLGAPAMKNVHRGIVSELVDNGFKIETIHNEILDVTIDSETRLAKCQEIKEGDVIVIIGERNDGEVQAIGVRKVEADSNLFPANKMRKQRLFLR